MTDYIGNGNGNELLPSPAWNGESAKQPAAAPDFIVFWGGGFVMNMEKMQRLGIALAIVWAIYKFGRYDAVKAAALGVGGVIVAKQIPYVSEAMD